MFTLENSLTEILADEFVKKHLSFLFPEEFVAIIPDELKDVPVKELTDKLTMPWGIPYLSEGLVESANLIHEFAESPSYEFVKLWSEETPKDYFPIADGTKDTVCLIKYADTFKAGNKMALIVPGGAYCNVAIGGEGTQTASALKKAGYAVAILNYRVAPNRYPEPQKDLALAIKTMRFLGKQHSCVDDLLVIGYSAGGHLVASETCYSNEIDTTLLDDLKTNHKAIFDTFHSFSAKADKVCLSYPVINCISEHHNDSFVNLTGGHDSLRDKLSIDLHVTAEYPKTFVWACDDDDLVPPSNAKRIYESLKAAGVEAKLGTYPTGGHGCATGEGTSAEGWIDEMLNFM
ncbi:Acetyl esterase/lipase [Pseudobutyrivibrio sp. YE44]|uniref:alpha/beta hydrolase n=1 Tax=Pseudobutyrivibrio sp. YE44 TaxID=1520802 RepID=UPI00088EA32E|nr:alpha/beta hydrolase [Pseudobutyrivibrio sp. YE44]SDB22300.1 Acetyl esterase/lipase [Pseudobutyrivibrio sp. YE44]